MNKQDEIKILKAQAFRGKSRIKSQNRVLFPEGYVREYARVAMSIMRAYEKVLDSYMKDIYKCLNTRTDADDDKLSGLEIILQKIDADMQLRIGEYEIHHRMMKLADNLNTWGSKQWGDALRKALGIDIRQDFFKGRYYTRMIKKWAKKNTDLIVRLPRQSSDRVKKVVEKLYGSGKSLADIRQAIQDAVGIDERYAQFLAVDQIGKLNCDIAKTQQTSVGVNKYIWSTSKDTRVRTSHRALHGKTFDWNNPPIVDAKRGRRCHPGEDYRCRCVAIPVFEESSLNIPVEAVDWSKVDSDTRYKMRSQR